MSFRHRKKTNIMEISSNTHRNFKSLFPLIYPDAEVINTYVGRALKHQDALVKKMTPHETLCPLYPLENKEKLDKFKIDIKNIDRLYHVYSYSGMIKYYNSILICRVEHDSSSSSSSSSSSPSYVYVKLYAEFQQNDDSDSDDDDDSEEDDDSDDESNEIVTGEILVSTNALLFLNAISSTSSELDDFFYYEYIVDLMRQSLTEDKILLIEDEVSDHRKYYLRSKLFYHTHKNFISFSEKCKDAETICRLVGRALNNQFRLFTKTTPQEMKALVWSKEEMNRFNINVEKIDRVYYIHYDNENPDGNEFFILICRVEFDNKDKKTRSHIYVKLEAECNQQKGFQDLKKGCGEILISTMAEYFTDYLYDGPNKIYKEISECIRKSLKKDDGIFIKKRTATTTTTTATDNNNNNPPPCDYPKKNHCYSSLVI